MGKETTKIEVSKRAKQEELPRFISDDCFELIRKSGSSALYQRLCGVDSS